MRRGTTMVNAFRFALVIAMALASIPAHSQLLPTRNFCVSGDTQRVGFMAGSIFFGEILRGMRSAGDDRAWEATVAGETELYRWPSGTTLFSRFGISTFANARNDIGFNPRSAQWEENLGVRLPGQRGTGEIALTYRCKHDIDNSDPQNSDVPRDSGAAEKRVLILGGMFGAIEFHHALTTDLSRDEMYRIDVYLLREDNRFPPNTQEPQWSKARASLSYALRLSLAISDEAATYLKLRGALLYTGRLGATDVGLEAGLREQGTAGSLSEFAGVESLGDDLSVPRPRDSWYFFAGLRISGAGVW